MNFTSPVFLFLFLPLVIVGFCLLSSGRQRHGFLVLASTVFYAFSGLTNLLVVLVSLFANYTLAMEMLRCREESGRQRWWLFWLSTAFNIGLLLLFKVLALEASGGEGFRTAADILIPLALSFITFQQISFCYSCYHGRIREISGGNYLFFILFFPQLVMGPIVRFEDIDRQLRRSVLSTVNREALVVGFCIFGYGLAKKVLLADQIFYPVDRIFLAAEAGSVAAVDMWFAVVGFQFQIFLDFSAYADMAIGIAKMFGINLPINFDRPLLARDRFDLWRRWHISFAMFMRRHVFVPLVRSRRVPAAVALAITGLLSGLWHGLSWTFLFWGLLQTLLMLATHYRKKIFRAGPSNRSGIAAIPSIASTFLITCLIGTVFRTPEISSWFNLFPQLFDFSSAPSLVGLPSWAGLALCAFAAWVWPDTHQLFYRFWTAIDLRPVGNRPAGYAQPSWVSFELSLFWAIFGGVLLFCSCLYLGYSGRFIYVQF